MENTKQIEDLLVKVNDIQKREKELSKLRGEHFNVFRLLGLEGSEVGFHTKFLFEFLNPEGSHGKGTVFFEEFIRFLNGHLPNQIEIPTYSKNRIEAKKEIYIGAVKHQDKEGGQIDLYFETESFALAIENKIYSGLGYLQLERYQTFLKSKVNKNHYLILLSPFDFKYNGSLKEGNDFFHLKYSELIPWLEYCMEKSADSPILRETIKQYIISVKGILGMLTNKEMKKELEDLILKNYEAARLVAETFSSAKDLKAERMFQLLFPKIDSHYSDSSWIKSLSLESIAHDWNGFSLKKRNWDEKVEIYFEGNKKLIEGIVPCFHIKGPFDKEVEGKLRSIFGKDYRLNKQGNLFLKRKWNYEKLLNLLNSNQEPEKMAEQVFDALVEMISRMEVEIDKFKGV